MVRSKSSQYAYHPASQSPCPKGNSGFSLIEVSIALLVISILMLPIIHTYNIYMKQKYKNLSEGATTITKSALIKYWEKNGFYPVPADPNTALGDAAFGSQSTAALVTIPVCTANSTVVCQTVGFGGRTVLIGTVPFAALGIPYKIAIDGFGRKLKYAVTLNQTLLGGVPFDDAAGGIEVNGLQVNGVNQVFTGLIVSIYPTALIPRSHFVVLSMGENGMGGFTLGGTMPIACAGGLSETENCNNTDATFRNNATVSNGLAGTVADGRIRIFDSAGANHFDDYVATTNTSSFGIWSYIPNSGLSMQSRNRGNIKIGTCSAPPCLPTSAVDVDGSVGATAIRTNRICNSASNYCVTDTSTNTPRSTTAGSLGFFSPRMLTGAPPTDGGLTVDASRNGYVGGGIGCYNKNALRGITIYDEHCTGNAEVPAFSTATSVEASTGGTICSDGKYAKGIIINATGNGFRINCQP